MHARPIRRDVVTDQMASMNKILAIAATTMLCLASALCVVPLQIAVAGDLASAGAWKAVKDASSFEDVGTFGSKQIALALQEGSAHFVLRLTYPVWTIQPGTAISLHVIFTGGDAFLLPAVASGEVIQANISDDKVASWTHNFTAMKTMAISFEGLPESPWVVSLVGTTPTVTAMALPRGLSAGHPRQDRRWSSNQPHH
jgi:hypothetical protein